MAGTRHPKALALQRRYLRSDEDGLEGLAAAKKHYFLARTSEISLCICPPSLLMYAAKNNALPGRSAFRGPFTACFTNPRYRRAIGKRRSPLKSPPTPPCP